MTTTCVRLPVMMSPVHSVMPSRHRRSPRRDMNVTQRHSPPGSAGTRRPGLGSARARGQPGADRGESPQVGGLARADRAAWPRTPASPAAISSAAIAHHLQRRVEHGAEPLLVGLGRRTCAAPTAPARRSTGWPRRASARWPRARGASRARRTARAPVAAARRRAASSSRSSSVNSPGCGHDPVEVLVDHRQRPLRQVAQLVGEVGVDPADDRVLAVAAVLAERHLAQQEVAHRVDAERVDEVRPGRRRCRPTCSSSRRG